MTDLRTAAQQALEALRLNNDEWEALADSGDCGHWTAESQDHYKQTNAAIAALEAALAQQDEPCPNCASLEAQNTELDQKLAELEQAYQSGYNAGVAHERKRIIQFLTEMQRQVGDGHNYYGVAAMRIRERV